MIVLKKMKMKVSSNTKMRSYILGEECKNQRDIWQSLNDSIESLEISTFANANIGHVRDLPEQIHRSYLSRYLEKLLNTGKLVTINENKDILKTRLSDVSGTVKQIQYLLYNQIIRYFIRVESTGNSNLHLEPLSKIINIFAAIRHIHKTTRLHLQPLLDFPDILLWVHAWKF